MLQVTEESTQTGLIVKETLTAVAGAQTQAMCRRGALPSPESGLAQPASPQGGLQSSWMCHSLACDRWQSGAWCIHPPASPEGRSDGDDVGPMSTPDQSLCPRGY